MPAPKKLPTPDPDDDWLVTYADAITLLLAFFVMLLTFTEYDIPAYQDAVKAIKENLGDRDEATPTEVLQQSVETIVNSQQADQVVMVEVDEKGVVIELAANAFYKPGSADIRPAAMPVLEKIAETLASPRYDTYAIEVQGHTDDSPISTPVFPSNWELSGGRATRIVRLFADNEILPQRMSARAYGDTRPKVPNHDAQGTPMPENQAVNRRIKIRVFPMSFKERQSLGRKVRIEDVESGSSSASGLLAPSLNAPETGAEIPSQ
ncbi:MAG: OmpA/MotB family protein [Rhodospirillales bacterium]